MELVNDLWYLTPPDRESCDQPGESEPCWDCRAEAERERRGWS